MKHHLIFTLPGAASVQEDCDRVTERWVNGDVFARLSDADRCETCAWIFHDDYTFGARVSIFHAYECGDPHIKNDGWGGDIYLNFLTIQEFMQLPHERQCTKCREIAMKKQ